MRTSNKGRNLIGVLICALCMIGSTSWASSTKWEKCVAADGSFSFHYPPGWSVKEKGSAIAVSKTSTEEVIMVIRRPFHDRQTATALAKEMAEEFKRTKQDFRSFDLRTDNENAAYLEASFTRRGQKFHSCVYVLKSSRIRQAYWFQYEALASEYSGKRGEALLKKVVYSLAPRHESQPPEAGREGEETGEPAARTGAGGGGGLVGTWASSESFGDVVDAGSGAYVRSAYTGEAYGFHANGTFWYLIIGSGTVSSGAALQKGNYVVNGNVVTLHSHTESWTPNPNKSGQRPGYKDKPLDEVNKFKFGIEGGNTLNFTTVPYGVQSAFHRTHKSQ